MDVEDFPELTELRTLVEGADLTAEARHTALWCLGQLPALYRDLRQTDEQRFFDGIQRLAQAVLKEMPGHDGDIIARFQALHRRLSLHPLTLRRPRKAG
jgi:hypothetical protein